MPVSPPFSLFRFRRPKVTPKRALSEMSPDIDDDQELLQDWRPSPEDLAKMTRKEKRQLSNKLSARNLRIRRKGGYCLYFRSPSEHCISALSKMTSQSTIDS